MIISWKQGGDPVSELSVIEQAGGGLYRFAMDLGLDPNDRYVLGANGFRIENPMCYTTQGIARLLVRHGPLWVATNAPEPHIRVITGMNGQTVRINDPAPQGIGKKAIMEFNEFFGAMESLGATELNQPSPVYVAYLKA
jgi:hypothetical protein